MSRLTNGLVAVALFGSILAFAGARPSAAPTAPPADYNVQAAARYLDARADFWMAWPNSERSHETHCISCHTMLPYAIARPALRKALGDTRRTATEEKMIGFVTKRIRLWKEVEPWYPDQTRGLPHTSESRGTESIMNAAVLAMQDAAVGKMSDEGRQAFANMWALQMQTGPFKGAWAWLNLGPEPWEAPQSSYFGASVAAIAIGTAPEGYASSPEIQTQLKGLREYLQKGAGNQSLFSRLWILWASSKLPGVLDDAQRQAIVDLAVSVQNPDGGWSLPSLAPWKRTDGSTLGAESDGYATALATLALGEAVKPSFQPYQKARAWLVSHQDPTTGAWPSVSVNKNRDPKTEPSKFMSDAATSMATLALGRGTS